MSKVKVFEKVEVSSPLERPKPPGAPRIVLLERDPYLAFLLRLHVPEAEILETDTDVSTSDVTSLEPDLVIGGIQGGPFPLAEIVSTPPRFKIVAIVDGASAARSAVPSVVDGVISRPFAPAELSGAVRGALGLGPLDEKDDRDGPTLERARMFVPPLRIAALAVAAVLEVVSAQGTYARPAILAIAFGWATLRWIWRRPSVIADAADIAVAVALIAATGGATSNYMIFGIVVVVGTGLNRGRRLGFVGGAVVVAGSAPQLALQFSSGVISGQEMASWIALFPVVGLAGGFAAVVWRRTNYEGLNVLVEANRVLSSLYRIARTLPGGLEIGSVAEATMHELRDAMGARGGAMLVADAGTLAVVGSFGLHDPAGVTVREPTTGLGAAVHGDRRVLRTEDFHPATARALGEEHECWLAVPMREGGIAQGLLLAACGDHKRHETDLLMLRRLAEEASVAVENARLFSRVREISIDEERRRLARELHDGVAQSLTHLRFELDFMARHGQAPPNVQRDISRLTRVVERTSNDVRSMILGLRSSVSDEGLIGSLRSYLSDLQRLGGPSIVFDARGEVRLPGDVEAEMFRVVQEAVSNALRHARPQKVLVKIESGATMVKLMIEDDGVGMNGKADRKQRPGTGVGIAAMRERAELIGAAMEIVPREPRGTQVRLMYGVKK